MYYALKWQFNRRFICPWKGHSPGWDHGRFDDPKCIRCRTYVGFNNRRPQ